MRSGGDSTSLGYTSSPLDFVPDHDTETAFAEGLAVPLEEGWVFERPVATLHTNAISTLHAQRMRRCNKRPLTAHVKHSQHHFPPSASTACIPSRILFLHFLHFGIRSRTWHASQYGWPLYTVKPTSSSALAVNAPSPANVREGAPGEAGGRKGSPHSAQKKCCSWYVRLPSSGSSSVMNRSSTIAVSQW